MENEQLVLRIRAGEDVAENMLALYQNMLGLIGKLARSFGSRGELEDLEQEGYIALCNAVRAYKPEEGTPFSSYATYWIRQGMGRYLENCGRPVRIPAGQAGLMRKYRRLCSEFQKEFGRDPSDWEAACALGISHGHLEKLRQDALMGNVGSLDVPVGDEGETTLGELQAAPGDLETDVVEEVNRKELKAALWGAVDTLDADQRRAVVCKYRDGLINELVGERLGITGKEAGRLVDKGLRELRKPERLDRIRPYLDGWRYSSGIRGTGAETFKRTWTSATERTALRYVR